VADRRVFVCLVGLDLQRREDAVALNRGLGVSTIVPSSYLVMARSQPSIFVYGLHHFVPRGPIDLRRAWMSQMSTLVSSDVVFLCFQRSLSTLIGAA